MTARPPKTGTPSAPVAKTGTPLAPLSKANAPPTVFLHPGSLFASRDPLEIVTIVGSCVAVCLWDPTTRIGGMNHFQMPHADRTSEPLRYGNGATTALKDRVVELGARRWSLEAKIFGGASILSNSSRPRGALGRDNVQAATEVLAELGIPLMASDVGGKHARKVKFRLEDGSAWVKRI